MYHTGMKTKGSSPSSESGGAAIDNEVLLKRIAAGPDQAAFEMLFQRHTNQAYSLALNITGHPQRAEDAVQEAFMIVWTNARRYRSGNPKAWILGIVAKKSLQMNRKKRERSIGMDEQIQSLGQSEGTGERLGKEELLDVLRKLVWKLPQTEREMVALHYGAGLSQAEIARELGMPPRTLSARFAAVLSDLREKLSAAGLAAGLPLLSDSILAEAVTSGCAMPAGFSLRVVGKVLSDVGRSSERMAATAPVATVVFYLAAAAVAVAGGTALYWKMEKDAVPPVSPVLQAESMAGQDPAPTRAFPLVKKTYTFEKGIPDDFRVIRGKWEGWLAPTKKHKGALLTTISTTDGVAFQLPFKVRSNFVRVRIDVRVPLKIYQKRGFKRYSGSQEVTWLPGSNDGKSRVDKKDWKPMSASDDDPKLTRTYTHYLLPRHKIVFRDGELHRVCLLGHARRPDQELAICIGGLAVERISFEEIQPKDLPEICRDPDALIAKIKSQPKEWGRISYSKFGFSGEQGAHSTTPTPSAGKK